MMDRHKINNHLKKWKKIADKIHWVNVIHKINNYSKK